MGLLAPVALFIGAAIAIPIILHLFQRHQGPRLVFPALRYLRRAEREHARRIKLRQLLLLALRVLGVLLLAVAAARPFLRHGGDAHAPSAVVIVLDNSASSATVEADRRVLDGLKARAVETLMRAGPDDRFWLLRAGAPWEPALRGDASTIADRVRETEPTASAADLRGAIERAAALASAGAEGRAVEVQLLSDLQASNLRGVAGAPPKDASIIVWAPGQDPPPNRGIAEIQIGGGLAPRTGERATVAVRVVGNMPNDTANLRLMLSGRTAAAGMAPSGATAVLQLPPQPQGILAGWAELDADALRLDDRRYFAVTIEPLPAVALGRPAPFIEEALSVLGDARRLRRADPANADILLSPGGAGLESAPPDAAVIIMPPEADVEIPGVNRRLATAGIPWRYASASQSGEARFADATGTTDPLLRQLAGVQLRVTYPLQPPAARNADSVVLHLRDGSPWAVRGQRASGGRFVLLGSPLSPEASTLPTTAAMLPFFDVLLGAWSAGALGIHDVAPGENVELAREAGAVLRPDGVRDTVATGEAYRAPAEPGVYRVLDRQGQELSAFVINASPSESDLTPAQTRRVRSALPGWEVEFANDPGEWTSDIYRHRLGRELWWPFLVGLLLLLIAESIVAAAGRVARTGSAAAAPTTSTAPPASTVSG
jgi:hypothetical protein